MYENLVTNLPKEIMCYGDQKFPSKLGESFVKWSDIDNYLKEYGKSVEDLIEFGTEVEVI